MFVRGPAAPDNVDEGSSSADETKSEGDVTEASSSMNSTSSSSSETETEDESSASAAETEDSGEEDSGENDVDLDEDDAEGALGFLRGNVPDSGFLDDDENEEESSEDEGTASKAKPSGDNDLEKRLALAYDVTAFVNAAGAAEMESLEFRQALAMMGKVFTVEETEEFFEEALAFAKDADSLGSIKDRDGRGLLKRSKDAAVLRDVRTHGPKHLLKEEWKKYFLQWLTRKVDNSEAANHFRALVEGAAEKSLRGGEDEDDRDRADGLRNAALEEMRETKHMDIGEIFIYAKDLRDVLVTLSERLTDEEADQLIRECRPRPKKGAPDGGKDRIYFSQYLTMLKDETI